MFGEVREQNIYATRRSRNLNAAFPFSPPPGRPFPGRNERESIRFGERPRLLPALFAVTSPPAPLLLAHLAFKQANQEKDGRTRGKIGKKKRILRTFIYRVLLSFFSIDENPSTMIRATGRRSIDTVGRMDCWIPRMERVALIRGYRPRESGNDRIRGKEGGGLGRRGRIDELIRPIRSSFPKEGGNSKIRVN